MAYSRVARSLIIAVAFLLGLINSVFSMTARASPQRANIVFILSDDEDIGLHGFMPKVRKLIEAQGTVFTNAFVTYSLCCPSRSTILRGQYPHNTGVLGNLPPHGGFKTFRRLKREQSTIGTWLQAAGYRTAFYGKYLNGYTERDMPPPGWNEWHVANNDGYFNFHYKLNENGHVVAYGDAPEDYLTDVIAGKAATQIRQWSSEGRPFFLYISLFNPHSPYVPAPRHKGMFSRAQLPRPPSFNERDVSDKPRFLQKLPPLNADDIAQITRHYRARLQSLQAIDDLVGTVVRALRDSGQLDNTYLIYTSDNGFHLGLHRMKEGKDTSYEEDIRVPLAVRGPGVPKGRRISSIILNNDFAPSFMNMAGASAPAFVDGRSFLPLFRNAAISWRRSFLIQRLGIETDERLVPLNALAIRTARYTYIAYVDGEQELYDLEQDPYQLHNIEPSADHALIEALSTRLTELKACAGAECRRLEDAPLGE